MAISQMMITELMTEGNKIFDSHYIINYYLNRFSYESKKFSSMGIVANMHSIL